MQQIKIIIIVLILSTLMLLPRVPAGQSADIHNISAYYGFQEMEIIKLDWGINNLQIADFNGDGRNDIAVVNNRKAKIELLLQKEAIGPSAPPVIVTGEDEDINILSGPTRFDRQAVAVSQKIYSFVCGDLNSDGMIDLAFYGEPKGLYVILQKATPIEQTAGSKQKESKLRTLSWQTRKKIKIDDGLLTTNALICADLNNDNKDDLVLAGRDKVYILTQEQGYLSEPAEYPVGETILSVEVGDLNGDHINDLVLITNDKDKPLHVRFGLAPGRLGPQIRFFIERPLVLKLANIDEIDDDEILTIDSVSKRLLCYKLTRQISDPVATKNQKDVTWPILFYPLASGEGSFKRDLVIGDFDGNGLTDIAISDPTAAEIILYKQIPGLGLTQPARFPAFADIESLSVGDIEGDGKDEIAVLSVKEKVIGISRFEDERLSFPQPIELIDEPLAMELADIDTDDSMDCIYICKDANDTRSMKIIYNLACPDDANHSQVKLTKLTSNPEGLLVVDVDQDGLQDVLVFVKYELPILIRQTQRRVFEIIDSPTAQASLIKDARLHCIAVANVDAQPGEELLIAKKNFARSLVFAGGKSWSIIDQYNAKSKENNISAVAVFDIDNQASKNYPAILLLDGQKGQLQILKVGEDKTYRFENQLDVGRWNTAKHLKMLSAPLTGSEVKNILLFDSEKFALIIPPGAGSVRHHLEQQFSYETKIKDGSYGNLTVGDINSDEWVDIVMVEYKRNHIEILALDYQTKPIPAMRFKVFEQKSYRGRRRSTSGVEPRELKIADVTGDGKNDLITIIHDRIIIYPQD